MSLADQIDNTPLMKMLTGIVMEGPGMLARGLGSAMRSIGEGLDSVAGASLSSDGEGFSLKGMLGLGGDKGGPEIAPARTPQLEISGPAQSVCKYECSMDNLGNLPLPNVGNITQSQGMGIG